MNETHKLLLEKLALPIIATVVAAALVMYFVSGPKAPAQLVLENIAIQDFSADGINKLGSWNAISISSAQRDKLRPAYVKGLRTNDDEVWSNAINVMWSKQRGAASLTTLSAQEHCSGLGSAEFLPSATPYIFHVATQSPDGKIEDSPLYGSGNIGNSIGAVYYVISWSLDTQFSETLEEIAASLNLQKKYSYPSRDSMFDPDQVEIRKSRINSTDPTERCTALRGAIMERMQKQVQAGDASWQASPPLLDILIRNTGQLSGTVLGVSARRVWYHAFDCGPTGNAIKPVSAPVVLPIASEPSTAHLADPISLDPLGTTRVQVVLDTTPSEGACGSVVVFDVFVNYFDGIAEQRLYVGRFDLPTFAGLVA